MNSSDTHNTSIYQYNTSKFNNSRRLLSRGSTSNKCCFPCHFLAFGIFTPILLFNVIISRRYYIHNNNQPKPYQPGSSSSSSKGSMLSHTVANTDRCADIAADVSSTYFDASDSKEYNDQVLTLYLESSSTTQHWFLSNSESESESSSSSLTTTMRVPNVLPRKTSKKQLKIVQYPNVQCSIRHDL
jgi:hypothetical protein